MNQDIEVLALTCVLIGAKFNEPDENLPRIEDFSKRLHGHYVSWQTIVKCEAEALQRLQWNMNVTTPLFFIRFICTFGVVFYDDEVDGKTIDKEYARAVSKYVAVFVDLSSYYPEILLEYDE